MLKDLSQYGNHGTCYSGATSWSCWIVWPKIVNGNGKNGKMMSFDGENDYISWNFNALSDSFTIVTILKPINSIKQQNFLFIWWLNRSGLYINLDGNIYFWSWVTPSGSQISSDTSISNTDFFVVWSQNKDIEKIYVNGKLKKSTIHSWYSITWNSFKIWADISTWFRYFWTIDEVRIYNRALSDSEIKALYQATK